MGSLDDWTNPSEPAAVKSSGGLDAYFNEETPKRVIIDVTPKPPISGLSKEGSDEYNQTVKEKKGGINPRSEDRLLDRAGEAIWDRGSEGILEAGKGIGEALSGKPASGIGKIGMGALSLAASPLAGAGQIAGDLTGSKNIADRFEFLTGSAVPLPPSISAINKARPKNRALSQLVDQITSDGRNPENLVKTIQEMRANPRLGPADLSPAVLGTTQELFVKEGNAAKNYLHDTSTNRMKTSADASTAAFDEAAGLPVNAVNKLRELSAASRKVGDEAINPAVKSAGAVNLAPVIEHIDSVLKPGVNSVISEGTTLLGPKVKQELTYAKRYLANEQEMRTGADELNRIQSSFRTKADSMMRSPVAEEKQAGQALMEVRNKIVDAIDKASGGKYKPALSDYRDEKHIAEAFHDAYNGVLTGSKQLENRPEFTKEWFDNLSKYEKEAAIEGLRTRIDTEIGVAKNPALAATGLGRSGFNQKKMEAVLGKEETERLLQKLEHERAIANTHNKVIEGSQTAARQTGSEGIKLSKEIPESNNPISKYAFPIAAAAGEFYTGQTGLATLATGALAVGSKLASKAKKEIVDKLEKERNLQYAKKSLPTEGPDRDQLIRDLESYLPGPKQSLATRAMGNANRLSRLVGP